jgi:TatD DNase family protein
MRFLDAHNHVQAYETGEQLDAAIKAAEAAGVAGMISCGTSPADWNNLISVSMAYKTVTPFFGLHPWYIKEGAPGWLENLGSLLLRFPAGVGEIGLDGGQNAVGALKQESAFVSQLQLAKKLGRPASVHCVKSWGRMLELIKLVQPASFMFHSYGGPAEMVPELAALGAYFSFSGALLDPKRDKLRRALLAVPADRLLFETESPEADAPGWRGGPAAITEVVAGAAVILEKPVEELAELSYKNGMEFLSEIAVSPYSFDQ